MRRGDEIDTANKELSQHIRELQAQLTQQNALQAYYNQIIHSQSLRIQLLNVNPFKFSADMGATLSRPAHERSVSPFAQPQNDSKT